MPLNKSCRGGVNFKDATAIVARKGTNSKKLVGFLFDKSENSPIEKISVIPKGSIKALGNSGKVSALHKYGKALLPALKYLFSKTFLNQLGVNLQLFLLIQSLRY